LLLWFAQMGHNRCMLGAPPDALHTTMPTFAIAGRRAGDVDRGLREAPMRIDDPKLWLGVRTIAEAEHVAVAAAVRALA
jgi:hypothetical protein